MEYKYTVAVRCMTYNHAHYIGDALRGFSMQETDFPVVNIIVDDASTDGEQNVIQKYLAEHFQAPYRTEETEFAHIACAHHKTNINCEFVVLLLKYNHYRNKKDKLSYLSEWINSAKYIAFCEGDDFWIHPMKLQMQVEYMEKHPDCGLIRTNFNRIIQSSGVVQYDFTHNLGGKIIKDTYEDYLKYSWFNGPCTILYRSQVTRYRSFFYENNYFAGTLIYTLTACKESYVHYLDEITACYRILDKSASHSSDFKDTMSLFKRVKDSRIVFANELPFLKRLLFYFFLSYQFSRLVCSPTHMKYWPRTICDICGDFNKLFLSKRQKYRLPNYDKNS